MSYLIFFTLAAATVASPGPGVILTLNNTLRAGVYSTMPGILGLAFGSLIVATISASGVGVIIATSETYFTFMKVIGALYLIYLGLKLWMTPVGAMSGERCSSSIHAHTNFFRAITLQFTNPKAVFFFISVLPQFIDVKANFTTQFAYLVFTYAILIVIIHSLYAAMANYIRQWLLSSKGRTILNKIGAATFICFGILLAYTNQ